MATEIHPSVDCVFKKLFGVENKDLLISIINAAMKDEKWKLASEYKKGIKEGRQEGEKIGIEKMVVNALRKGIEVTTIVEWSGFSEKEIQKIKDKHGL